MPNSHTDGVHDFALIMEDRLFNKTIQIFTFSSIKPKIFQFPSMKHLSFQIILNKILKFPIILNKTPIFQSYSSKIQSFYSALLAAKSQFRDPTCNPRHLSRDFLPSPFAGQILTPSLFKIEMIKFDVVLSWREGATGSPSSALSARPCCVAHHCSHDNTPVPTGQACVSCELLQPFGS